MWSVAVHVFWNFVVQYYTCQGRTIKNGAVNVDVRVLETRFIALWCIFHSADEFSSTCDEVLYYREKGRRWFPCNMDEICSVGVEVLWMGFETSVVKLWFEVRNKFRVCVVTRLKIGKVGSASPVSTLLLLLCLHTLRLWIELPLLHFNRTLLTHFKAARFVASAAENPVRPSIYALGTFHKAHKWTLNGEIENVRLPVRTFQL
jgi:hypothetical protein